MIDSYRHRGLRQRLVVELKRKGIRDQAILEAIGAIPRHFFLDEAFADWAYKDVAFPIDSDQTISQPYTVAFQTQLLELEAGDKVLEIGTGSGYQACVLAHLGAKVYTIERHRHLFEKTNALLGSIGFGKVRTLHGDGYKGAPRFAPFNKILVTCGAHEVPAALKTQVAVGGHIVIPVGGGDVQEMVRLTRQTETYYVEKHFGSFRFVPFIRGISNK